MRYLIPQVVRIQRRNGGVMKRWLALGSVCLAVALAAVALPLGAQAEGPTLVTRIAVDDDCISDVVVAAQRVVFAGCEQGQAPGREVSVASPGAEGEDWDVLPDVDTAAQGRGLEAIRSSVAYANDSGGLQIMDVGPTTPSLDDVELGGGDQVDEVIGYAISATVTSSDYERFVVPVRFDDGRFELAIVTRQPQGPPGPNGPTGGGWGVELTPIDQQLGFIAATAIIDEHVYVASDQHIVEIHIPGDRDPDNDGPLVSKLVFSAEGDGPLGVENPITDLFGDAPNERLLVQLAPTPFFSSPVAQPPEPDPDPEPQDPLSDAEHTVVTFSNFVRHLQLRSASESVTFSTVSFVSVLDIANDGSIERFTLFDDDSVFYGDVGGTGETLAVVESNPATVAETEIAVYDLTGWVAPESAAESLPEPPEPFVEHSFGNDPTNPLCVVPLESNTGYCFADETTRMAYIENALIDNPQYGTIWIGRFDEEVVAP